MSRRTSLAQRGTTTVEFAVVGAVLMLVLLGVVEFGRLLYTYVVVNEGARRAARVASVCPIGDAAIPAAALYNGRAILRGVDAGNVAVEYLDALGGVVAAPAANFAQIRSVRVRMANVNHEMFIPLVAPTIRVPEFPVTLPRESLGVVGNASAACRGPA